MKIKLSNGWYIEDEVHGYAVYKDTGRVDKQGAKIYDYLKYPTTLERCVEIIVRHNVIDDNDSEITLLDYIKKMKEEFNAVFSEVNQHINEHKGETT